MKEFSSLQLKSQLYDAIEELGFEQLTPIQKKAYPAISSGRDMMGIAQTGTGKTLGYMLPLLQGLAYSEPTDPRILVLVPTRELVVQVVDNVNAYAKYLNLKTIGIYGGTNINTQKKAVAEGVDVLVATPGRLYDLIVHQSVSMKKCKKVVIDEVDVMLDLGFRFQLNNIFDHIPKKRQNIMISATMTDQIEAFIKSYFRDPQQISVAVSGERLENIEQVSYPVPNFYTKANLVAHLVEDQEEYKKVLVFVDNKRNVDRLFDSLPGDLQKETVVIHSNKTQNYRLRSIESFNEGRSRVIISTDVMARGLDLEDITHVINVNTPNYPENYIHRIGRTGRADKKGKAILLFTSKEEKYKAAIESLMEFKIPVSDFPDAVEINHELIPEEKPAKRESNNPHKKVEEERGAAFHEKKAKNQKTNQGGSYRREIAKKYKKPKTRGDKNFNRRKKK